MVNRKKSFVSILTLSAALLISGCSGSDTKTNTETGGAKGGKGELEDKIVVYSPHGKDILSKFERQFEDKYGIDVEWLDMGSQEILDRVRSEKNNPQADVWWGAPSTNFNQAKDDGLLAAYKPTYSENLDQGFHDPEWYWTGTSQTPEVIMYNSKELSKDEVPKDWDELLDSKWKDEIIIRYPLASGTMRTIFSAMIYRTYKDTKDPEEGYDWLKKLDQNTKEYSANPEMMYNKVAKGEGSLSVWAMPDVVMLKENKNYPFEFVIPESGTPVLTEGIAVVEGAKHPKAAEAFYEFVNSPEAAKTLAEEFYRIPTRSDVKDLPEWITETEIKAMDIDWDVFQEKGDEWMKYWDENIKSGDKEIEE
ncbi:extracellular solute-binding protein [Peribacillus muralis]|uniref:extracellular solute-binding protein n=1 Tax=Peribacillus muralis TaxID=264697 RepID=UPI001F4E0126|nr:extracellular solute-binding protein [Peribacillus muralis]MCK1993996.1 extracellular solute-binding protein [Peribacillus muralis]MCK2014551.1 extracellular solute-binding protein [Peribacillus muralis]